MSTPRPNRVEEPAKSPKAEESGRESRRTRTGLLGALANTLLSAILIFLVIAVFIALWPYLRDLVGLFLWRMEQLFQMLQSF